MSDDYTPRRIWQAYKRIGDGFADDNPYHNVDSGAAAIMATDPKWRPPYDLDKGPSPKPRMADTYFGMSDYLKDLAMAESSGGKNLINKASSARGRFQLMPAKAKELGITPADDDAAQEIKVRRSAENDIETLRSNGYAPTFANLYALHWGGLTGGLKLLNAPDDTPANRTLSHGAMVGNYLTPDMTAGDVKAWLRKQGVVDDAPAGQRLPAAPMSPKGPAASPVGGLSSTLGLLYPNLYRRKGL